MCQNCNRAYLNPTAVIRALRSEDERAMLHRRIVINDTIFNGAAAPPRYLRDINIDEKLSALTLTYSSLDRLPVAGETLKHIVIPLNGVYQLEY